MTPQTALSVAAVLAAVLGAGCLDTQPDARYPAPCQGDGPQVWGAFDDRTPTRWTPTSEPESDPRQPWRTVVAMQGDPAFDLAPERGNASVQWTSDAPQRLGVVTLGSGREPVGLTVTVDGVDCVRLPAPSWGHRSAREGALGEVGRGALVHTAGFWENGTVFYTNMPEVHDGPEPWPRAGWYEWGGDDPLQVYVYDERADEMPAHWGAGRAVPEGPLGMPSLPGRYGPTIPGFNEALKGLSTSTLAVVRVAPEDAYTRPGYEQHPLYGDALVFLLRIEAVADQPCPPGEATSLCFRR